MYRLPPLVDPLVARFLADDAAVDAALERFGSPLNVLFPEIFLANLAAFCDVLATHGVTGRICYAHKVNQATGFVAAARRAGIDLDVASPGELASGLAAGFPAARIEATGPKGERFLRELVTAGVTVNVDNLWELETLVELAGPEPVPVLLRLSGFDPLPPGRPPSRFGIDRSDAGAALALLACTDRLLLRGFAFHLDSSDVGERLRAVRFCLTLVEDAYSRGLSPRVLDIGGGFRQVFSADPEQFQAYVHALTAGLDGTGPALGWPGHTFGYRPRDSRHGGIPAFHKYGADTPGPQLLAELLGADLDGQTVAAALRDLSLELWMEPGKALVDWAGITLARVELTKRLADGSTIVGLDLSRDTITPVDQEVMLDPVILPRRPGTGGPALVFLGGNLCLERDLVFRHLIEVERLPVPGDVVAFVNTAAYQMDLSAAGALLHPRPVKVVVHESVSGFEIEPDRPEG